MPTLQEMIVANSYTSTDIQALTKTEWESAVFEAIYLNKPELLELLITEKKRFGDTVDIRNASDMTPLMAVCAIPCQTTATIAESQKAMVTLLEKAGANFELYSEQKFTSLAHAIRSHNVELVNFLIYIKKVNVNARNPDCPGATHFMIAAMEGNTHIMKMLLDNNAKTNDIGFCQYGKRQYSVWITAFTLAFDAGKEQEYIQVTGSITEKEMITVLALTTNPFPVYGDALEKANAARALDLCHVLLREKKIIFPLRDQAYDEKETKESQELTPWSTSELLSRVYTKKEFNAFKPNSVWRLFVDGEQQLTQKKR